jgi:hypothetical protein
MKKILVIMLLAYFSLILTPPRVDAGWLVYRKPEFKGKVIDAASREPIKGAVVAVMYYSAPILTGPGGGSPYIIHVKESLTDENGMFLIPSYTTLIQPNSLEDRAEFIIYKPGYGKLPSSKVIPDIHFIDPEEYFSKPIGMEGEMRWESGSQSRVIPVTYGIVELPKLETKEERLRAIPGRPSGVYEEDLPLFYRAINEEHDLLEVKRLGR